MSPEAKQLLLCRALQRVGALVAFGRLLVGTQWVHTCLCVFIVPGKARLQQQYIRTLRCVSCVLSGRNSSDYVRRIRRPAATYATAGCMVSYCTLHVHNSNGYEYGVRFLPCFSCIEPTACNIAATLCIVVPRVLEIGDTTVVASQSKLDDDISSFTATAAVSLYVLLYQDTRYPMVPRGHDSFSWFRLGWRFYSWSESNMFHTITTAVGV